MSMRVGVGLLVASESANHQLTSRGLPLGLDPVGQLGSGGVVSDGLDDVVGEPVKRNPELLRDCVRKPAAIIGMCAKARLARLFHPVRHQVLP
jgi:hypothetical protein